MLIKWIFDRVVSAIGLLVLWPVMLVIALLIRVRMPGGPVLFVQKRVGKDGQLFKMHKFRTMVPASALTKTDGQTWSSVTVGGDARVLPLGKVLRKYKLDELPELYDVMIGNMSFVGPRPDVPGYADMLRGEDREMLNLRPGITGPATLKYRAEEELIAAFVKDVRACSHEELTKRYGQMPKMDWTTMNDEQVAQWYNDEIIFPDKVRINRYYLHHYSFVDDIRMILCTVLGKQMPYAGEMI